MLYFDNWVRKSYKLLLFWFEKKLNHRGEKRHFLVTQQETF